jgi:hypothetical protein
MPFCRSDHPGVDLDGWKGRGYGPILHSIATYRSSSAPEDRVPDMMFWVTDPNGNDPTFTSTRSS